MDTPQSSDDDATARQLRLLVGLVVVLGSVVACLDIWYAAAGNRSIPPPIALVLLYCSLVIGTKMRVYVRVRSNNDATTWDEIPIMVGLLLFPMPWVVICAAASVLTFKIAQRSSPQKIAFAVAKSVLITSAAGAVLIAAGVRPDLHLPQLHVLALIGAYLALWLVDDLVYYPVIAIASHITIGQAARHDLAGRILTNAAKLATVVYVVAILSSGASPLLLIFVPLIVSYLHLWQSWRLRTKAERSSWQQLSHTIDELSSVELSTVLKVAATRAAGIFSADVVEIDLSTHGVDRVVRADAAGVIYDGPGPRQFRGPTRITAELETGDGSYRAGVVVLGFHGRIRLTEFETYKLKTYASALCTAIRNASAYSELQRISAQNAYEAAHDALTGLANRRELYERTEAYFRDGADDGVVALLIIDLNHFKEVNDTLGHAAGDRVLREVARRLDQAAAPGDLVARLGGDEFAVLLVNLPTPALATHRAKTMLSALETTLEVEGMHITIEAAGGIALAPGSGGVNELMRRADIAMYQAKRAGQQTATYAHAQDTADVSRLVLGGELSRAVAEREFVVEFQPIVDLGSGEVISAEALARWHHPEHGYLTPMEFLETVERSGQLPAFADAVLDQSLAASDVWREAGFDLPIAVNVSPRSLLDPRFPDMVLACLQRHAVPADRLVLELAETLTISQLDVVGRALTELRQAGVRLALDDFGTGVSPLSVLSHIPVHELKIDRDFVGAVETSSEAAAVIRSTVDLARSLHLAVIAEGVESEPQRHALWELGCVAGQGHLFARPMSSARLLATLQRGTGGRPGTLAAALHDGGAVVRMPRRRPATGARTPIPHQQA